MTLKRIPLDYSRDKPCHFSIHDYEEFGQHICQALRQYLYVLSDATYVNPIDVGLFASKIESYLFS
jgi:hypothetical protein